MSHEKKKLRVLDLFSGIGGFSLGLKRTGGFRTVGYCEIDPYCQQILQARMRDGSLDTAPICTDVSKLDGKLWRGRADVVCGGFPCQDISPAGPRVGIEGKRSGLWTELHRILCEVRPQYGLIENVSDIALRGADTVFRDLAGSGFHAEWSVVSACSVGAPHLRRRMFILAYPNSKRLERARKGRKNGSILDRNDTEEAAASLRRGIWGSSPSRFVGMDHGVPHRMERLHGLGNAVVPQVVEWIGRRILEVAE